MDTSKKKWSKSVTLDNGDERTVTIREISNGFIARLTVFKNSNGAYSEYEVYMEENPWKDMEMTEDIDTSVMDALLNPKIRLA